MPKTQQSESVLHDWVHELPFQMQALLLTAMRGPDENNKYNAAKAIIRYLRGVVIKPAGDWNGQNNNDFMWGEYIRLGKTAEGKEGEYPFSFYSEMFWQDHDEYPHHFIMHLVHCAEVVAYKHPDKSKAPFWGRFYYDACDAFHMNPESEEQMDNRLNDFGCGIHNKKVNESLSPKGTTFRIYKDDEGSCTLLGTLQMDVTEEEYYEWKGKKEIIYPPKK